MPFLMDLDEGHQRPPSPTPHVYDKFDKYMCQAGLHGAWRNGDQEYSFHPEADFKIIVETDECDVTFHVVSAVILAASPIWRELARGNAETHGVHGKFLELDDDPFALVLIFHILHGAYRKMDWIEKNDGLRLRDLYEIARVVRRYECPHVLGKYKKAWLTMMLLCVHEGIEAEHALNNPSCSRTDAAHNEEHPNCAMATFIRKNLGEEDFCDGLYAAKLHYSKNTTLVYLNPRVQSNEMPSP